MFKLIFYFTSFILFPLNSQGIILEYSVPIHQNLAFDIFSPTIKALKKNPYLWLVIHQSETDAMKNLEYALDHFGGVGITIHHSPYTSSMKWNRYVMLMFNSLNIFYDPNRIFDQEKFKSNVMLLNSKPNYLLPQSIDFFIQKTSTKIIQFLSSFWKENIILIALHNNQSSLSYSLNSYENSKELNIFKNQNLNPKNFFYVLNEQEFQILSHQSQNVVYQKKILENLDGSLSDFAKQYQKHYINIESQLGDYKSQIHMIQILAQNILHPRTFIRFNSSENLDSLGKN